MRYLTLDFLKAHCRIDGDCENELIERKGAAAENAVLNLLNRTLEDLMEANGGEVPDDVINATAELAENFINHRSPTEQVNLYVVPYGFDIQLKPYMVL